LKKSVFRYIEAEIYDYHETLKEIDLLREEILEGSSHAEASGGRSTHKSDPTSAKVSRLLMDRRLQRLEEIATAIGRVYDNLPREKQRLVELKYWDGRYSNAGVAHELHIGEMTFYRWRRQIIQAIARELGLLDINGR
jgi:RinA family phage transcriptional activator